MSLELSIACGGRDLNAALLDGDVEPEGVDATTLAIFPSDRHRRFFRHGDFDVSEVSLATYLSAMASPEATPFTAVPVFPEKKFRHSFFYKRTDSGIDTVADLAGRPVGISSWQTTANVWMRGIAAEHYDLDLEDVQWHFRKRDDTTRAVPERYDVTMLSREATSSVGDRANLETALLDGTVDAVMDPSSAMFRTAVESEEVEFVFDDPLDEERSYFEETGIHPIMHTVAVRDAVLDEHPWVAQNVVEAFRASKDACLETNVTREKTSLTWAHLHRYHQDRILGDTWEYGLTERNERTLSKLLEYAADQGLIEREYEPAELFYETTVDDAPDS